MRAPLEPPGDPTDFAVSAGFGRAQQAACVARSDLMLSIGKLVVGQQRYYEQQVAQGRDDYYSGRGEAPGEWAGAGARCARPAGPGQRASSSTR